jgi:hypothetical protein
MALLKALLLLAFSSVGFGGPLVISDPDHFSPTASLIKRSTLCDLENMSPGVVSPKVTSKRLGSITYHSQSMIAPKNIFWTRTAIARRTSPELPRVRAVWRTARSDSP